MLNIPKEISVREKDLIKISEELKKGIETYMTSEKYTQYLKVVSKFHTYSFNNTMLITQQKPNASFVAGFKTWKDKFGRTVKKGESAIRIIAPVVVTDEVKKERVNSYGEVEEYTEKIERPGYKSIPVFDISQTEGKEFPTNEVKDLEGNVSEYNKLTKALVNSCDAKVTFGKFDRDAKGYYSITNNEICIKEGLSEAQTLKTLIHEIAHSIMHNKEVISQEEITRRTSEIEAESVAYIVCNYLGIDASDYSFPYIASWVKEMDKDALRDSMNGIIATSDRLINALSYELEIGDRDIYAYRLAKEFCRIEEEITGNKINPEKLNNTHVDISVGNTDQYIGRLKGYSEGGKGNRKEIGDLVARLENFTRGFAEKQVKEVSR